MFKEEEAGYMLQLWFFANTILSAFLINLGGLHLGLNVIVLMLAGAVWLVMNRRIAISSVIVVSALFVYLIFSLLVAVTGPCNDLLSKVIITGPILTFLVLIGFEIGRRAEFCDWIKLQKVAAWALLGAFSSLLLEIAVPSLFPLTAGYRSLGEYSGLFSEPSHVAFSLFPCVAVLLVAESRKVRRNGMLALLGLLVFSKSSTLIALIVAWLLYRLIIHARLLQAGLLALGFTMLIALGSAINYDRFVAPTVERIVGISASSETGNISSLVYVQGWQDGWANLVRTHGLGLGFNMMGCHPLPDVPARAVLALHGLGELNAQDGSILFPKVISESGVFGIVFYIMIIRWWIQLEKRIRIAKEGAERFAVSTQAALIFCFVATSFIRSASYFGGGLLLWIVAISGTLKWQHIQPAKPDGKSELSPDIGH